MGNENSGWKSPENGGTHGRVGEVVVTPQSGPIKAIVFTPTQPHNHRIVQEVKSHVAQQDARSSEST